MNRLERAFGGKQMQDRRPEMLTAKSPRLKLPHGLTVSQAARPSLGGSDDIPSNPHSLHRPFRSRFGGNEHKRREGSYVCSPQIFRITKFAGTTYGETTCRRKRRAVRHLFRANLPPPQYPDMHIVDFLMVNQPPVSMSSEGISPA